MCILFHSISSWHCLKNFRSPVAKQSILSFSLNAFLAGCFLTCVYEIQPFTIHIFRTWAWSFTFQDNEKKKLEDKILYSCDKNHYHQKILICSVATIYLLQFTHFWVHITDKKQFTGNIIKWNKHYLVNLKGNLILFQLQGPFISSITYTNVSYLMSFCINSTHVLFLKKHVGWEIMKCSLSCSIQHFILMGCLTWHLNSCFIWTVIHRKWFMSN